MRVYYVAAVTDDGTHFYLLGPYPEAKYASKQVNRMRAYLCSGDEASSLWWRRPLTVLGVDVPSLADAGEGSFNFHLGLSRFRGVESQGAVMWRIDAVIDDSPIWQSIVTMEERESVQNAALMLWLMDVEITHVRVVEDHIFPLSAPYSVGTEDEWALVEYFQRKGLTNEPQG